MNRLKKGLVILLVALMLFSGAAVPALAMPYQEIVQTQLVEQERRTGTSDGFLYTGDLETLPQGELLELARRELENLSQEELQERLFITEDVAYYIALMFLQDVISMGMVDYWSSDTVIMNTVTMYDYTGETISAYSFELTSGYIVVSALLDVPNLVLEWAPVARPVYETFDLDESAQIIYLGALNYFADDGSDVLVCISGDEVFRDEVDSFLEEFRDIDYISENALLTIASLQGEVIFDSMESAEVDGFFDALSASPPGSNGPITNTIEHANRWFAGPFRSFSWQNHWEPQMGSGNVVMSAVSARNHCGPTAVANILRAFRMRNNDARIPSSHITLLNTMISLGQAHGHYNPDGGTSNARAPLFIQDAFRIHGVTAPSVNTFNINYTNLEISLRSGRLMYVMLWNGGAGHPFYGRHHVVAYAYARLRSDSTGWFKTYLKIADGWSASARFIDLASATNDRYVEVRF